MDAYKEDIASILYSYYIKYDKLLELNAQIDAAPNIDKLDIYIDIYDVIRRVYGCSTTGVNRFIITAAIINLAAHYRAYYRTRHHVWARIFLVYGSEITNNHRQFCPLFNNFMDPSIVGYERTNTMIQSQIEMVKILAAYINDVYYVERKTDFTMFTYDNILKSIEQNPESISIVISKNKYAYQIPAMLLGRKVYLFRPSKYKGEDRSICIAPNTALVSYYAKVQKSDVRARLQSMNPALLSLLMTFNGCRDKGVTSFINISKTARIIDGAINANIILNGYQSSINWVYEMLNTVCVISKFMPYDAFINRFRALDLAYQHLLYTNMLESKDISWNLNLKDPDTVRDINNKYFIEIPLDLNNL